jgi:hypothetical protein
MKRIILIAALAVPAWMAAQEKPPDPRAAPAPGQPAKKQPSPSKTDKTKNARLDEEAPMPNLSRSPTGYVEDAAVGTQVRFRFDAGFGMTAPDRAEFFYAKCGCYRTLGSPPADANAPGPGSPSLKPVIVTKLRFQEAHVDLEYGLARRFSLFVDASARSIQPQASVGPGNLFGTQTGFGDLQAGFKFALLASREGYLTFQLRNYFPTGDAGSGLGTNHYSIEPTVLFTRKVARAATLSGQFSVWHPIQGSSAAGVSADPKQSFAGNVLEYGFGAAHQFLLAENLRVSPVVELVGWNIRSGYVTLASGSPSASGSNIVNAKLGARIFVERHNSIYVGFGRQLSHVGWYRDFLRVEYARVF